MQVRELRESGQQHQSGSNAMNLMLIMMWVFFGLILCVAGPRLGRLLRKAARGCGYFAETTPPHRPAGRT